MEPDAPSREETAAERSDRHLTDLLGELRVGLPGVQVLFAFLLVVPFNARFDEVTAFQEKVYLVTLLCTALASALLIAPSMHHRLEFGRGDKEHVVAVATRLTIAGLTFLAIGMTGTIVLVCDFLFGTATTVATAAFVVAVFAWTWYAMPLRRLRALGRR